MSGIMDERTAEISFVRTLHYFLEIPNSPDFYKCLICSEENLKNTPLKSLSGKKKWNLKRHLRDSHRDIYDKFIDPEARLALTLKRLTMIQNFCEIVTINGRTFSCLLDSGFLRLIGNDLKSLEDVGLGISMHKDLIELKEYIHHVAEEVRQEITKKLDGRFVPLLLDLASKNQCSVVGIGVQYIDAGRVKIHSLGIIALDAPHTATYIKKVAMDCLSRFNVPHDHAIAMVTDNASAMIAMTRQFNENVQETFDFTSEDSIEMNINIPQFDGDDPLTEDQMRAVLNAICEIEALNQVLDDEENFEELFEVVVGQISNNPTLVTTIRCACHSIQLIVRDAIKTSNIKSLLPLCKNVSKKMRTEKFKYDAKQANIEYSNPSLSSDTRWDGDYLMLCDLVECEEPINFFARSNSTFKTVKQKMPVIQEIMKILKIPFEVTKMLQKQDATLSDFYGWCIMLRERLKTLDSKRGKKTNLAQRMLHEYEKRSSKMLNNQATIAAVYLDRRFSAELDENQIGLAKLTLSNFWERIRKFRTTTDDVIALNNEEINTTADSEDDELFDFGKYFQAKGIFLTDSVNNNSSQQPTHNISEPSVSNTNSNSTNGPNYLKSKSEFLVLFNEFETKFPIIDHEKSIINFWEEQKRHFPEIYEVANILFSIPPSQAAIERAFSQWGFVFSCRRCHLGSELLENIMMIKLNKDLANTVFENDLKKTKTDFENALIHSEN